MLVTPTQLVQVVSQWHLRSHQGAQRNALSASTALTERRRELLEVEEFLAEHTARAAGHGRFEVGARPA